MTKSRPHLKSVIQSEIYQDDQLEGTSARTRPLDFEYVMLARKKREETTKQVASDVALVPEENVRHTSIDSRKGRSRRKEATNTSTRNEKSDQDKHKRHRDPDAKSKSIDDKNINSNRLTEGKSEKRDHINRKRDHFLNDVPDNRSDKRQARDLVEKDRVSDRREERSKVDRKQLHDVDRQVSRKRKTDEPVNNVPENEYKKRKARDVADTDKLTERGIDKPEKENTHRHHNEEDKTRGKSVGKQHDLDRKGLESTRAYLEESRSKRRQSRSRERDNERGGRLVAHSPKVYKHATKEKKEHGELLSHSTKDRPGRDDRGRRSPGRDERGRRSLSHSPKVHKLTSKDKREHGELLSHSKNDRSGREERSRRSHSHSPMAHKLTYKERRDHGEMLSHSTKDRSEKEHNDVDTKRISNNGSNSHYRRTTGSSSGLGGYSPRKRKSDVVAKTPSPTRRSPERRTAGWDLQPAEKESTGSSLPNMQISNQNLSLSVKEFPSGMAMTSSMMNPIGISLQTLSSQMHAIEAVQLTQATRPMRRLYVENLPASASEKDLTECINKFVLSSGVNYIQGAQPCISCIIHKEKGQALLEFLTPEDASAALSLDGISFAGCNLKFRRPKDYANVTTGPPDKPVVAAYSVSGKVEDSPHKIFIGGISKRLSSKMFLEIAKAFGPVKAFHIEFVADIDEQCAFLEYADHSVTSKACAGLNGMKLGGRVLTAVFATPHVVLENVEKLPFYGIPEQAKPLLEKPTAILKLKNALDPEGLLSLAESELDEMLEDIRLECSRFGMVKSVNVAKPTNSVGAAGQFEVQNCNASADGCDVEIDDRSHATELGNSIIEVVEASRSEGLDTQNEMETNNQSVEDNDGSVGESLSADNLTQDKICEASSNDRNTCSHDLTGDSMNPVASSVDKMESNDNIEMEDKPLIEAELRLEENDAKNTSSLELDSDERKELEAPERNDIFSDHNDVFEPGSIFVEYKRAEAACMAAHCLNGRTFGGRVVTVGYVGYDLYSIRFLR